MQSQSTKSATTAGLLGIFLGAFGAHNWYLGEKNKGIIHVCMMGGGVLVEILATAILPNVMSLSTFLQMAWLFTILTSIASLVMAASGIWGLVEGIIILSQGDAGLARKGYAVANPPMMPNQNYGYNNFNGYPQNGPQGYGPQQNFGPQGYGPQQNFGPQGYEAQSFNQPMGNNFSQPNQPMNNNFPNGMNDMNNNPNMPNGDMNNGQ